MPKRKSYTVTEKLEAVTRVKQHSETQAKVSRENGVPESTLRGWIRDEKKMRDFVDTVDSSDGMKRKLEQLMTQNLTKLCTAGLSKRDRLALPLVVQLCLFKHRSCTTNFTWKILANL
jgi:transposase-like protein